MINEKDIALRYIKAQKRRSALLIIGIILAIALISSIFSMLEILQKYEIVNTSENGVWHIMVKNCTQKQSQELSRRADVSASGKVVYAENSAVMAKNNPINLRGADKNGATQMNFKLKAGTVPLKDNQIALEQWVLQKIKPGAYVGDSVTLTSGGKTKTYLVSGVFNDIVGHKMEGSFNIITTLNEAQKITNTDKFSVLMQIANGVDIDKFVSGIEKEQSISKSNITQHTSLLDALGRGNGKSARDIYLVGAFLAFLVIFAAIMMIYNIFNISVTQRIRQFGMLRAIGATPKQIRKIIKSEALFVSLFGVLPGLISGIIASNILLAFLRYNMPEFFVSDGPAFYVSWLSLLIGAAVGMAATLFSSLIPARKAGRISPVEAISSAGKKVRKKKAMGIATKIIPVESALSFRRLMTKKCSFILISLSLSFGVLLILCFNPLMDVLREGSSLNYDFGDMYVMAGNQKDGFSKNLINDISKINGIEKVYPKRITSINATFPYKLLGDEYKSSLKTGWLKVNPDTSGMVKTNFKSTIVGITDDELLSLKPKLMFGDIDPNQLDDENGVILLLNAQAGASSFNVSDLRPGDYIYSGSKKLKICGVIKTDMIMYAFNQNPLIGMYTTNKVFDTFSSANPNFVTMTLNKNADSDSAFSSLKNLTNGISNVQTSNQTESKDISNRIMLICNVFVYGFITIIALIGILNIINTMSTNIMVRTREIGLLRAGGMTMGQVTAMVVTEAALYGILALIIGLAIGIPLERQFYIMMVKQLYSLPWVMPWNLVVVSSLITFIAVILSILSPLHRIKNIEITEAVTVE